MALVYGCEPSFSRSYLPIYHRTGATNINMASSASHKNATSSQCSVSGPSSSPPIPIPPRKAAANFSIPTPNPSHETNPKTPDSMQRTERQFATDYLPPTPRDCPPQMAQRKPGPRVVVDRADAILDGLKSRPNTRERLKALTEDVLMELRSNIDGERILPFEVDENAFEQWDQEFSEVGGYEYDPATKRLTINTLPKAVHERVISVFNDWFRETRDKFQQQGVMNITLNEGMLLTSGFSYSVTELCHHRA